MKKSLLTLLLTAFCFAAFAMEVPLQQDTTKVKQHQGKKMGKKSSKTKSWKKTDSSSRDTTSKMGRTDSTQRPPKQ
jgi:hypothetical protein